MQADAPYRTGAESLSHFYTPSDSASGSSASSNGIDSGRTMIPLSNVVHAKWDVAPPSLTRYNGFAAVEVVGAQAPGHSSGEAMTAMQNIIEKDLPAGVGYDWAGQSHQEILSGSQTTMLMVLSIVVVFLCLAALYESWSVPVSVLLVVPVGVLGAIALSMARGLPNDIYFKIGLITVMGLAAKNAILIVEFAIQERKAGKPLGSAVVEAAKLRLRPILMTSLAFIMGVLPLAISTGAGANARHAIGTGVIGGMLAATFLGLLFIPVFYTIVRRLLGDELDVAPAPDAGSPSTL
jgi:multidrug efflux pump